MRPCSVVWVSCMLICLNRFKAEADVWPKPRSQINGDSVHFVESSHFKFSSRGWDSSILEKAFDRYTALLFGTRNDAFKPIDDEDTEQEISFQEANKKHRVTQLRVKVHSNDQSLGLQTDEEYTLNITKPHSILEANSVFGALRGLESFVQLLSRLQDVEEEGMPIGQHDEESKQPRIRYQINETSIHDEPRFQHRGLLIDTARHFLPLSIIYEHLDAMSMNKLNVLHWHIVDDQSFPYASEVLPKLSEAGAFSPEKIYTLQDIKDVVDYARARGIRVIPEFDTPGHTLSWGKGYPELLADCYDEDGKKLAVKGPMEPTSNETYSALWKLLQEIGEVFPERYVHLGGDEVPLSCWENNPDIKDWMKQQDPVIEDMPSLEQYFERKVLDLAKSAAKQYIIWQEIVDNGVQVQQDTVVHVWKWWWPATPTPPEIRDINLTQNSNSMWSRALQSNTRLAQSPETVEIGQQASLNTTQEGCSVSKGCMPQNGFAIDPPAWTHEMQRVIGKGHKTLLSSPWYLNLGGFASNDWAKYYAVEPLAFDATEEQKQLVIGGEACMWGEYVDETNAIQRTWPRASAVAERLWSDASVRDPDDAFERLKEQRCRMRARGIGAEPLGPGSCPET